jgi:peptidylamidoglycolate lyase
VFHRPGRGFEPEATELLAKPAVLEFDADSGALLASWGAGMFLVPHGITLDGDNNVWLTDVGLQQVFEFSHDGKLLLTLGQARVGGWDATHFNQPTDIAIRNDGSFYVSDGYVNSRVALFDRRGAQIGEWGWKGNGEGAFSNPHGLAFGPGGDIFVADRENSRIQIFDERGRFKRQWLGAKPTGRVFAVAVDQAGSIYAGVRRADYDPPSNGRRSGVQRRPRSRRRPRRIDLHRRNPHQTRRQASPPLTWICGRHSFSPTSSRKGTCRSAARPIPGCATKRGRRSPACGSRTSPRPHSSTTA